MYIKPALFTVLILFMINGWGNNDAELQESGSGVNTTEAANEENEVLNSEFYYWR